MNHNASSTPGALPLQRVASPSTSLPADLSSLTDASGVLSDSEYQALCVQLQAGTQLPQVAGRRIANKAQLDAALAAAVAAEEADTKAVSTPSASELREAIYAHLHTNLQETINNLGHLPPLRPGP